MPDEEARSLLCRADERLCSLPIDAVIETMRPLPIEPIAGAPDFVLGVSVVRGAPVAVVDARRLLGAGTGTPTRLVMLKVGERRVALAVDSVIGVRRISAQALQDLPPLFRNADAEAISKIGALDSEFLVVLKSMRLVPEAVLAAVESEALAS